MMMLTDGERADLVTHEITIERGQDVFFAVGLALLDIRERRLYRDDYDTFEAYCQQRWDFGRHYAYRLMSAAVIVENLLPIGNKPDNEAQARELVGLEPDEQRIVWQVVTETAPGRHVTAAHVKSVVEVLREIQATGAVDAGDGEDIPISAATAAHLKAAITEQTFERMQRQAAHILESNARAQATRLRFEGLTYSDLPTACRMELTRQGLATRRFSMLIVVEAEDG